MIMSLAKIIAGVSRLSLESGGAAISNVISNNLSQTSALKNVSNNLINHVNRCTFHTSATLERNLDSHRAPKWMLPSKRNKRWVEPLTSKTVYEKYEYTINKIHIPKTGGRGPNGRIWFHRRGGGHKRMYRMIAWSRGGPQDQENGTLIEKIQAIKYDPNRSARIALVASGDQQRYVIATEHMKAGDLIKSTRHLTGTTVRPEEGCSYPVGCLPIGTLVNTVERFPGDGGRMARSAGVTASILRKTADGMVIVRLPSRREVMVSEKCTATVGRVSNIDHNKRVIGKAGRNRWLGIRPKSGRWHRKDGRFGRKIKGPKPVVVYDKMKDPPPEIKRILFY